MHTPRPKFAFLDGWWTRGYVRVDIISTFSSMDFVIGVPVSRVDPSGRARGGEKSMVELYLKNK